MLMIRIFNFYDFFGKDTFGITKKDYNKFIRNKNNQYNNSIKKLMNFIIHQIYI